MKAQIFNYSSFDNETNPTRIKVKYVEKLVDAGFNIEDVIEKHFEPQGFTALYLLSESHFAIHTFPEEGQSYVELSSCVKAQFDRFIKLL